MTGAQTPRYVRAEDLLNRPVRARNGRVIGRIEELRVERHGERYDVTAYVLGPGGLLERLAMVSPFASRPGALVARWDQIDLSDPRRPRLTCERAELQRE
jgi:hypothetical protein